MDDLERQQRLVEYLAKPVTAVCPDCAATVTVPGGMGHAPSCDLWEGPKDPAARLAWKQEKFIEHYRSRS
jgi:hypothetical protein